jgi:hypothetical protein
MCDRWVLYVTQMKRQQQLLQAQFLIKLQVFIYMPQQRAASDSVWRRLTRDSC